MIKNSETKLISTPPKARYFPLSSPCGGSPEGDRGLGGREGLKRSVSVLIPNYNGRHLLEQYLPALFFSLKNSEKIDDYEIIVVDDASKDDSISFLQKAYPDIILIESDKNQGFSISVNQGFQAAEKELVFLLNNDMSVSPDIFDVLIPFFDFEDDVFGVFPTIKNQSGEIILETQKLPCIKKTSIHYIDNYEQRKTPYTFYLCGGCSLISREKVLALNGLDTIYSPFYFEDFDLSIRAWKQGWKCYYTDETYCLHCHSATIISNFSKRDVDVIFWKNKLTFNHLHTESIRYILFRLKIYIKFILTFVLSSTSKKKYKESYRMYALCLSQLKHSRKNLIQNQKYSIKTIVNQYFC